MIEPERQDDALHALLRAGAPEPLADDEAERSVAVHRRRTTMAPIERARALVAERQLQAQRARQWRWAIGGAIGGYLLMLVAMAAAPTGVSLGMPGPSSWIPIASVMAAGALWVAWRELRAG